MSVSNMSSSAWTTNLSTGSEPNVSYAERLRQARSQSAGSKTRSSTSAQPQTTKRADPKLATSSPPQSSTGMSSKNNMRSIKSPNSKGTHVSNTAKTLDTYSAHTEEPPESSSQNVWELRMRRRSNRDTNRASDLFETSHQNSFKTGKTQTSIHQSASIKPAVTTTPPTTSTATAGSKASSASVTSSGNSSRHLLDITEQQPSEPDRSLEGADDDAWIQRIFMLNGGKTSPRFVKNQTGVPTHVPNPPTSQTTNDTQANFPGTPSASSSTPNRESPISTGWPQLVQTPKTWQPCMYQANTMPMYVMTPYGFYPSHTMAPVTNTDGSFSPRRSSDSYVQQNARQASHMPMGYTPYVSTHDMTDGALWSRRGRAGRCRGGGSRAIPPTALVQNGNLFSYAAVKSNRPSSLPGDTTSPTSPVLTSVRQNNGTEESEDESIRSEPDASARISTAPATASSTTSTPTPSSALRTPAAAMPFMISPMHQRGSQLMPYSMPMFSYMLMDPAAQTNMSMHAASGQMNSNIGGGPLTLDSVTLLQHLRSQVEFYFSEANLVSDFFLRQQMDKKGFVALETLLSFKRLRALLQNASKATQGDNLLTDERQKSLLCSALVWSQVLELNETCTKVRRRNGWKSFVLSAEPLHKTTNG